MAYFYGQAAESSADVGAMAVISLGAKEVSHFLNDSVVVACENSASSTTIAGAQKAVEDAMDAIKQSNASVSARLLKVKAAYHSREWLDSVVKPTHC